LPRPETGVPGLVPWCAHAAMAKDGNTKGKHEGAPPTEQAAWLGHPGRVEPGEEKGREQRSPHFIGRTPSPSSAAAPRCMRRRSEDTPLLLSDDSEDMTKPLANADAGRHIDFDTTPSGKPHMSGQGSIVSADIRLGDKLEDGYAITTVFERRKPKTAHRRCLRALYDHVEYFYATHLVMPDEPDEHDSEEDKAETRKDMARVTRNRCCCCWCWILLLLILVLILAILMRQDDHEWRNQTEA
jgi:hypothetical protein